MIKLYVSRIVLRCGDRQWWQEHEAALGLSVNPGNQTRNKAHHRQLGPRSEDYNTGLLEESVMHRPRFASSTGSDWSGDLCTRPVPGSQCQWHEHDPLRRAVCGYVKIVLCCGRTVSRQLHQPACWPARVYLVAGSPSRRNSRLPQQKPRRCRSG